MHASPRSGTSRYASARWYHSTFDAIKTTACVPKATPAPAASQRCKPLQGKSRRPPMASARTFDDLVAIMNRLRDPDGCPWDREQTYATLRGFLIEECYEVVDALDRADLPALCEELGDLLFQIVFLARLAREDGAFAAADVVEGIAAKMVRRHPHVFAGDTVADASEVLVRWEEIKKIEKKDAGRSDEEVSVLAGIPPALPPLVKAPRLCAQAARVGFDWRKDEDVLTKLDEEAAELRSAVASSDRDAAREEIRAALST